MALNVQVFRTRALTAVIFVAVMLIGLLWNFWSFVILFTIIHFGCWHEFVKLQKKIDPQKYLLYSLLGLLYITMPVLMMLDMYQVNQINISDTYIVFAKGALPITIILSIWINDTMAYIVGSFIGKTPLSKISPKKTWEGTLGGIILSIVVITLVIARLLDVKISITYFIALIAAISAVFGTLGDLLESKIKRMADVKDSGSFMPGHGGFLDRFDSLLIATPFVWLYIRLLV